LLGKGRVKRIRKDKTELTNKISKGETVDFVFPGFLGFLWYSQDFHGIPGISMGFPGFPSDFKGLAIPGIRRFPLV
jgi:hypothetical protein